MNRARPDLWGRRLGNRRRYPDTQPAARPQSSALTALCSVGLLDVLSKYDCGGLGRKPCQDGAFGLSRRPGMRNAG